MLSMLLALAQVLDSTLPVEQIPGEMLRTYLRVEDYPPEAIAAGEQGRTAFEVLLGTDGRVKQCVVTEGSGSPILDSQTCRLMTERLRFTPAEDEDGRPMEARAAGALTWQLPKP